MDQLSALTVLGLVFAVANLISMKTRARVSMMFICSCIFLVLFQCGLPRTIFDDTKLMSATMTFITLLMVQMGSMMDATKLKEEWKTVCVSFLGMCAGAGAILLLASPFISWDFAVAATGPVSGGGVAGLIMTEAAKAKGLTAIGVFVIMLLTVQGFFGIPLASNCLLHEGKKLKERFAAGERATQTAQGGSMTPKKRLIPPMPKKWQNPWIYLCKALIVSWISVKLAALLNNAVHPFVMALILSIVAHELGFIETNVLQLGNANGMVMFVIMIPIFVRLRDATPQMILDLLGPLFIVFAATIIGIMVASIVLSKIFKYSWFLSAALSATCMIGFPGTLIISEEVASQLGESEEEREFVLSHILPKMLIAGFTTVTIASVFLAAFLVKFF